MTVRSIGSSFQNVSNLDILERPQEISKAITSAFNRIKSSNASRWSVFNGADKWRGYRMLDIKEGKLLKTLILEAPLDRNDFYFLDMGAGNFQSAQFISSYINKQKNLREGIKVHIIGIRGEDCEEEKIIVNGKCIIYKLGAFKIENLIAKLEKQGLFLFNSIDVIISRWTFRHLVDPVGTFIQAYDLLRPGTGCILMDGFFFCY